MSATNRRRRAAKHLYGTLRVCTQCGCKRVLASYPTPPGESKRGDVCTYCLRFPSTVYRAA